MKPVMFFIFLIISCILVVTGQNLKGFTVDLIRWDSPHSPFYDPSATLEDQTNSHIRQSEFQSTLFPDNAKYLVKFNIGTPPLEQFAIVDTGSSLVWIQCFPCTNCFRQSSSMFFPFHSSSYKNINCTSQACHVFPQTNCGGSTNNQCLYQGVYGDSSFTRGEMATETFTFDSNNGSQLHFPNTIFGCGYNNNIRATHLPSGVIGLGRAPSSLNSQLRSIYSDKFSYCLVPPEILGSNSKLRFGEDDAFISGANFVSTSLFSRNDGNFFYYLRLEGITIGGNRINNDDSTLGGNMMIDSGAYYTMLTPRLYTNLEAEVRRMINLSSFEYGELRLCYPVESFTRQVADIRMIFHFTGGADITLGKTNIFVPAGNITCFAILPSPHDNSAVLGARSQINFHVQYDVANNIISFAPGDCTKFS